MITFKFFISSFRCRYT